MFIDLIQFIQSISSLSENQIEEFTDRLEPRSFEKGERLLEIGEVCRCLCFLQGGSFRQYCQNEDLTETTINLFTEKSWILNRSSFIGQKPSESIIEACEKSETLVLTIHHLHDLISKSPAYLSLGKILEGSADQTNNDKSSPEDKYSKLISHRPEVLQKFPLKHIASYLGMTPETLSRVRGKRM